MIKIDISPGIHSVKAELDAGIRAIAEGCFGHAHAILLALFLAPEIPLWFRRKFCTEPLRTLARSYLPTRAALRRMRHHAAERLIQGEHSAVLLGRALMLDDALDDTNASRSLLERLDVLASHLLVSCRDTVVPAFARHGDMSRARKYLGNYRDAAAALATLQDASSSAARDWAQAAILAHADLYVRSLKVIQEILDASGERRAAEQLPAGARLRLTDQAFRACVERELREPGQCERALHSWLSSTNPESDPILSIPGNVCPDKPCRSIPNRWSTN